MKRINWGGSLTSYIAIGVVILLLVGGLTYAAQARGNQARQDRASAIAAKQAKTASDEQNAVTKADSTVVVDTPVPATSGTSTVTTTSSGSTVATASTLPETGIAFSASEYLGLGLLVALGISYVSSRRNLVRAL